MDRQEPFQLRRYVVAGVVAAVVVGGLLLLVRPFIFSFAGPLTDANYTIASAIKAQDGPLKVEIVLNDPHGLPGEVHRDKRVGLTVVVSPVGTDAFAVVDGWSPTNNCALTLGPDRLTDCQGSSWTFDGIPLDPADPPLVAFPTTVNSGAVVVDFTHPHPAAAS